MPAQVPEGITLTYAQQYRRCGKPSCSLCAQGGRGHGPYWYAYWREDGRTRTRYLGKQPPPGAGAASAPAEVTPHLGIRAPTPAAPPAPDLRVRTLGGFALWRDGEPLAVQRWARRREGALLKWLLAAPGHRLARDEAVERFWPEAGPERGVANLRVLAYRLRRALADDEGERGILRYDGEVLALALGADGWLDAEAFAQAARAALAGRDAAACRAALALYAGDYLPDDAYEEWALRRREELRQARVALLLHLASLCAAGGEVEDAEGCLRAALAADPCREEAALALMRLLAEAGRPGQGLRVYRRLAEALREELGLGPERATRELARDLAARQADATAPAVPVPYTPPTNLPAPLSSFVGRRRELAALRALFGPARAQGDTPSDEAVPCRLLTLTGPGGAGKTRLALRLAEDLLDEPGAYPDGVWLVELASLAGPMLVSRAVAQALGVREEPAHPLAETLAAHLRPKRLLLLLDNCEHLLDACAELTAALLTACPGLQVLATSRAALEVPGERRWPVPALSLPAEGAGMVGRLPESEAARLFLERARVQRPDLALAEAGAAAVARICRRLEGIPLALELAAARTGVLSLAQIADRLGESFELLAGGPRAAPARQRTLRATLDWSHDLLSAPEQALLRRLAVFAGGCTLEAAEAVCSGEGLAAKQALDLLAGLARHSLLQVEEEAGAARYRLLETVRQYAHERLDAVGEQAGAALRHATYYLALAEEAEPALAGPDQEAWFVRLEREHDNLRAVLHRALDTALCAETDVRALETGLRLAGALRRFWEVRGHPSEGRRWLEELLMQARAREPSAQASAVRAKALHGAGGLAWVQGDYTRARMHFEEGLALRRELGDKRGIASSLTGLGVAATTQGDYAPARAHYEEALALFRALGDKAGISHTLDNLGDVEWAQGDYVPAVAHYEEDLALRRELGDKRGIAISLTNLGAVAWARADPATATMHYRESLAVFRALGDKRGTAFSLVGLGLGAALEGERARGTALLEEGLSLFREVNDRWGIAHALTSLGGIACEQGDRARAILLHEESVALCQALGDRWGIAQGLEGIAHAAIAPCAAPEILVRAARLLGAAARLRATIGAPLSPSELRVHARATTAIHAVLGEAPFDAARAEGQALTPDQAVALALDDHAAGQPRG